VPNANNSISKETIFRHPFLGPFLSAQTFADSADWAAAICGTIISDNLGDLTDGVFVAEQT